MIRRQHALLALLLLGATALPSACTLPFAYVDDGGAGEGGDSDEGSGGVGTGATGTGAASPSGGSAGNDGSGAADSGGGGPSDGGAASGGSGGASTGGASSGGSGGTVPDGVYVDLAAERQVIQGFGLNATIMPGSETLPWAQLFSLDGADALGLSILRIGMNESGGHRGVPTDWETARDTYDAKIIGTCWTAPAAWKDNASTTGGGHLLTSRYADWATRIATYANANNLHAMSIGNQTDFASCSPSQGVACSPPLTDEYESMVYTGKELAEFLKVAGPIFDAIAPGTLLIAPEASSWTRVWSNLSPTNAANGGYDSSDPLGCGCFSNDISDAAALATCESTCAAGGGYDYGHWMAEDAAAWSAVDILGVHQYESQVGYPWPADVNGGVKDKEVWQTEMAGTIYWPEQEPSTDIANGVAVAGWIHSALTVGEASAWLYWWYEAYYGNHNEGLALLYDTTIPIAKRYFTLGNYSKFVRPGYVAVEVVGNENTDLLLSAYKGPTGEVVVVAINKSGAEVSLPITIFGGAAPSLLTPTVTSESSDLVEGTPVTVADAAFTATLPGLSVTTFVGE